MTEVRAHLAVFAIVVKVAGLTTQTVRTRRVPASLIAELIEELLARKPLVWACACQGATLLFDANRFGTTIVVCLARPELDVWLRILGRIGRVGNNVWLGIWLGIRLSIRHIGSGVRNVLGIC
ncbi:MAG: hypothetical protein ACJAYU_000141 [Bradymonadia bacterium]